MSLDFKNLSVKGKKHFMKKKLFAVLFASISSYNLAYASKSIGNENQKNLMMDKILNSIIYSSKSDSIDSLYPPRKKRRGSPYRSGTGGKKWGGKVGSCAKRRKR